MSEQFRAKKKLCVISLTRVYDKEDVMYSGTEATGGEWKETNVFAIAAMRVRLGETGRFPTRGWALA